jgi:hypothetical protein
MDLMIKVVMDKLPLLYLVILLFFLPITSIVAQENAEIEDQEPPPGQQTGTQKEEEAYFGRGFNFLFGVGTGDLNFQTPTVSVATSVFSVPTQSQCYMAKTRPLKKLKCARSGWNFTMVILELDFATP